MAYQKVLWFLLVTLGFTECAFVDSLEKCHLRDEDCQKNALQTFLKDKSQIGVPIIRIPPFDPIVLKNVDLSLLNVLKLKIIEGEVKGIKNCIVDKFVIDLEKSWSKSDITCNIVLKGKYYVHSDNPVIKNLLGGEIHGEGNGKTKIDKINIKFGCPVKIEKRGNDTFLIFEYKKVKYSFDVLGNIVFAADQLYLGDKESSKEIVALLNQNWRLFLGSFGSEIVDVALNLLYDIIHRFYNNVPTKHFILDDLSEYVE